jgi:ABC-type polysaccharide/polyol phosphate transport system ATPase subunit
LSAAIISVENLGKKYRLGGNRPNERYTALRDVIAEKARTAFRPKERRHEDSSAVNHSSAAATTEDFWALKDVSFEVKQGEVLGIIGRNGAGKSTLLKILSRITEPTEGRVELCGRLASLLEVGTGFHPELTGRENIYLNGAILGMTRAEIQRKFDEIVAFAEVEKFLDTPVKRYSSGMYVRLAFAVAAHLEPEILVVDEVLAVGDAEFQRKCLGKMRQVSACDGRTVLFVSHNLEAVRQLCSKGLLLKEGKVSFEGSAYAAADIYVSSKRKKAEAQSSTLSEELVLQRFTIAPSPVLSGSKVTLEIGLQATQNVTMTSMALLLYSRSGTRVGVVDLRDGSWPLRVDAAQAIAFTVSIDSFPLVEGSYSAGLYVATALAHHDRYDLLDFSVAPPPASNGVLPFAPEYLGYVRFASTVRRISV